MTRVPNQFPTKPSTRRLALIGEAAGREEESQGKPFCGQSGQLLNAFLAHAGIDREACFVGNICQARPPNNDISKFKWDGAEIQSGIAQLTEDLRQFQPHLCLLLGGSALRAFAGEKRSIKDWKGYVWQAREIVPGVKCVGAWHPAAVLRNMGLSGEEKFFMARAVRELATDDLVVPKHHVEWSLGRDEIIDRLREWRRKGTTLSADIEGSAHTGPACHGFADSPSHALVVPIYGVDGRSIWSEDDEVMLIEECAAVWEDPSVPKIIQNASFEMTVLLWTLGIVVEGLVDDTMLKHAELYAEMEKSLEFQACIYTNQPFWKLHHRFVKAEGRHIPFHGSDPKAKRATSEEWFIYNGTDCCVTYECNDVMNQQLKPGQRRHYEWNVKHLARTTYASLRGWRYNKAEAERRLTACVEKIYELQDQINQEAARSPERKELQAFYQGVGGGVHGADSQKPSNLQEDNEKEVSDRLELLEGQDTTQQSHALAVHNQPDVVSVAEGVGQEGAVGGRGGTSVGATVTTAQAQSEFLEVHTEGLNRGSRVESLHPLQKEHTEAPDVAAISGRSLLPLLTTAFCQVKRTERREVEEVTWQPMRWKAAKPRGARPSKQALLSTDGQVAVEQEPAGKWVKDGKRVAAPTIGDGETWFEKDGLTICGNQAWQRHAKFVTRNVPVEITSLEDVRRFTLGPCRDSCERALRLLSKHSTVGGSSLTPAQRGELATLLGISLKLNATGRDKDEEQPDGLYHRGSERDANWFVYEWCKSPPHFIKERGRNTDRLTSNDNALISIWLKTQDPRIKLFMDWRSLDTRREALEADTDPDGRMRCSYTIPGTETMRLSCKSSITGSGYSLHTVTEELRDLFLADEGCEVGQLDLKGADGWTVAAECARLGDETMLLDLLAGIKPANVIALIYTHGPSINRLTRDELLIKQQEVLKTDWRYIASKKVQHGGCYLMAERKMSETLMEDSFKETGVPIFVEPRKCKELQEQALFLRYPGIKLWHQDCGRKMMADGMITTSLGWSRRFFGRKRDGDQPNRQTLGEWLGTVPQFFTTAVTKLALERLWDDPTNRRPDGSLIAEPLHTVHDSLNLQWRIEDRAYAAQKLKNEWFNNPVTMAGRTLTIPASGTYGPSWGEQETKL